MKKLWSSFRPAPKTIGANAVAVTIISLLCACDPFGWAKFDDSPDPYPNNLSAQDSVAIRAILDANGLDTVEVRKVITLQNSEVVQIKLDSMGLTKLVLTRHWDSLFSRSSLSARYNQIDTLIVDDTILKNLGLTLPFNRIRAIPADIGKLRGELALNIARNEVREISPAIMGCRVTYINVGYNGLCTVSDTMRQWLNSRNGASGWTDLQTCP